MKKQMKQSWNGQVLVFLFFLDAIVSLKTGFILHMKDQIYKLDSKSFQTSTLDSIKAL